MPDVLSKKEVRAMDAYWRAANYLSVGQIYLLDNPLLKKPLTLEHIKPRLLGHWGTTPGLNFLYVHLNRLIKQHDLNVIYIAGPGHGGPGLVANVYLEGTYSEVYPNISQDTQGLQKLFKQLSFPGGIPSHVAPETPGSIHEGGELGYALSHAYGAAFDNPDLIVACVVGDGEAETGPLATAWHSNKFLNPVTDGAVLPILHLNSYKIANPTVLARISHEELESLLIGYGYTPYFVEGSEPEAMHQLMASTLDTVLAEIQAIQREARTKGYSNRPRWPMIVLRTPKGWTGPKEVDGEKTEGYWRSHQVPMAEMAAKPGHIKILEQWMKSYKAEELFDATGKLLPELAALAETLEAESLTRVLYPDDSTSSGQGLRFVQEYFLVACSLADLVRRFRRNNADWNALPEKVAIQLNDTHPTMAVPELMRILLDEAHLEWDDAWDLTRRTLAYTNHTLLPEALEKWPVAWFEILLPRHLEIIFEINRRLLDEVRNCFPDDDGRVERISLIEEGPTKHVRMANLAIVGSHSTNGVAAIHSQLLRTVTVKDLAELFPERFSNKTNGVTPRRWLLMSNPALSDTITEAIGTSWMTDLSQLSNLQPLADDRALRFAFLKAKREAKSQFADWLKRTTGEIINPGSIFDSQIKRIHEYKRQLLNALRIVVLYNRLRENPNLDMAPRTFFFSGKAAPAYQLAKVIIKFINNLAGAIDDDPAMRGRLKVLFLPDYCVSLAERLIPASDVSNQISTAGYEASGTSNMKFMMNGALTIGTRDGATIEMAEEAGEENFFLFGLTADQVAGSRDWYSPQWHYDNESETRAALDLIFSDHFSPKEPGIFAPLRDALLTNGDYYMHLADLKSYLEADQRLIELYTDVEGWARKAVLNFASSGKFSSDRTIAEYATDIWQVQPCPVP